MTTFKNTITTGFNQNISKEINPTDLIIFPITQTTFSNKILECKNLFFWKRPRCAAFSINHSNILSAGFLGFFSVACFKRYCCLVQRLCSSYPYLMCIICIEIDIECIYPWPFIDFLPDQLSTIRRLFSMESFDF